MLKGQLYFAGGTRALCSRAASRAQRVELEAVEASGAVIHDGVIRASVEQEHGGFAVQLTVEQNQTVDGYGRELRRFCTLAPTRWQGSSASAANSNQTRAKTA